MESKKLGELMVRVQAGDKESYRLLLQQLKPEVDRIIRSKISDPNTAEDISQAVFLKIHVSRQTYNPTHKFSSWINAITRNLMIDYFKKGGKEDTAFTKVDPNSDSRIEGKVESVSESALHVREALDRLDDKYSTILDLLGVQGLSIKEAATTLGVTEAAVKMRKKRAMDALKEELSS